MPERKERRVMGWCVLPVLTRPKSSGCFTAKSYRLFPTEAEARMIARPSDDVVEVYTYV